jgi:excisionase family DNA binding protein
MSSKRAKISGILGKLEERTMTTERLTMNVSEACEKLGLSAPSLRKALKRGEIPHLRIGARILIPISALNKYLASVGKAG